MCLLQSSIMQGSAFYIGKDFIAQVKGEEILQRYPNVDVLLDDMKIVGMVLEVTTHRLLLRSNSVHCFLIKGEVITEVGISESGFFSKEYFVKISTQLGKVKLALKSYNEARVTIEGMVRKRAWLAVVAEKKEPNIYTGVFDKISKEKEKIAVQGGQVSQSFASFDQLFGNLREIKRIMSEMKTSSGQSDGDNPEVNRILNDMGFVSVISKDEEGKDYYRKLAANLYEVCQSTLFKNFGGMVALLDLYYFYNKKRQMSLLSPEELLKACELFPSLGFQARVVHYPNNIVLLESTTFDPAVDFEQNFAKYFTNFTTGYSSEEIARKKGLPVAIVDIKLGNACKAGKLAVSDRIEGLKYYKNLLLTI